jgi:hypothetical protein
MIRQSFKNFSARSLLYFYYYNCWATTTSKATHRRHSQVVTRLRAQNDTNACAPALSAAKYHIIIIRRCNNYYYNFEIRVFESFTFFFPFIVLRLFSFQIRFFGYARTVIKYGGGDTTYANTAYLLHKIFERTFEI